MSSTFHLSSNPGSSGSGNSLSLFSGLVFHLGTEVTHLPAKSTKNIQQKKKITFIAEIPVDIAKLSPSTAGLSSIILTSNPSSRPPGRPAGIV
jgi:hypothetical protein